MATIPTAPIFLARVYDIPTNLEQTVSIFPGHDEYRLHALRPGRPYVTLTFAQSLDAKTAGSGGKQLALSGNESMIMTHWIRTLHDGIIVGIGTALNDNPQLNTRHLPSLPADYPHRYHLPRPIILDSHLRLPANSKLLKNYREGTGRRPWVITSVAASRENGYLSRRVVLQNAGARIFEVETDSEDLISVPALLLMLQQLDIRSVMVEGGARVIQSFLAAADSEFKPCVDTIIITVAPTFVGCEGVSYNLNFTSHSTLTIRPVGTEIFGRDSVVALKVG